MTRTYKMVDIDNTIRSYLGSKYRLVGIKILNEIPKDFNRPKKPLRHCQMVREAALGKTFTYDAKDLSCPNAELALGFVEPKYVDVEPRIKPSNTKAVRVGPVEGADVVLAIVTPKQLMDLAVISGGISAQFKGEIAVCGEATAKVFMEGKPNITVLCNGARILGEYKDSELIVSLPYDDAKKIAEKIAALEKKGGALCGCLTSDIPKQIILSLKDNGFEKGTDYFFGRIDDWDVRIYLDKDQGGRYDRITIHVPVKGEVKAQKPFTVRKRGNWSDVTGTFEPEEIGINLNSGENLKETIRALIEKNVKME